MGARPGRGAVVRGRWPERRRFLSSPRVTQRFMISVVIPTLNEQASMPGLLAALLPLVEAGAELIVVDGGSEDETVALVESAGARVVLSERGRAKQMNAGAEVASGELVLFLHADSEPDETWCRAVLALPTDAAWGFFRPMLIGRSPWLRVIGWFMWQRSRLTGIGTGDQCLWVNRAVFGRGEVFPDQPLMEDVEFCKRARRRSRPLAVDVSLGTSGRRWERNGVMRTVLLMWWLRLKYWLGATPSDLHRAYYG